MCVLYLPSFSLSLPPFSLSLCCCLSVARSWVWLLHAASFVGCGQLCIRWCEWISHSFSWMCFLKVLFNIWCNYNRHQATTLMQTCLRIHTLGPSEVLCHLFLIYIYIFFPPRLPHLSLLKATEDELWVDVRELWARGRDSFWTQIRRRFKCRSSGTPSCIVAVVSFLFRFSVSFRRQRPVHFNS